MQFYKLTLATLHFLNLFQKFRLYGWGIATWVSIEGKEGIWSEPKKAVYSGSISTPGELNTGAEGALHTTVSASNVL